MLRKQTLDCRWAYYVCAQDIHSHVAFKRWIIDKTLYISHAEISAVPRKLTYPISTLRPWLLFLWCWEPRWYSDSLAAQVALQSMLFIIRSVMSALQYWCILRPIFFFTTYRELIDRTVANIGLYPHHLLIQFSMKQEFILDKVTRFSASFFPQETSSFFFETKDFYFLLNLLYLPVFLSVALIILPIIQAPLISFYQVLALSSYETNSTRTTKAHRFYVASESCFYAVINAFILWWYGRSICACRCHTECFYPNVYADKFSLLIFPNIRAFWFWFSSGRIWIFYLLKIRHNLETCADSLEDL